MGVRVELIGQAGDDGIEGFKFLAVELHMVPGLARFAGAGRDLRPHGTLEGGQVEDGVHEGSHFVE